MSATNEYVSPPEKKASLSNVRPLTSSYGCPPTLMRTGWNNGVVDGTCEGEAEEISLAVGNTEGLGDGSSAAVGTTDGARLFEVVGAADGTLLGSFEGKLDDWDDGS